METYTLIYILISFSVASFLKGMTGLGYSTICLGLLTLNLDPKISIPLVILPSVSSNLFVMIQAGNFISALKRFWPVYVSVIPGVVTGFLFLSRTVSSYSRAVLGAVLMVYAIWALLSKTHFLSEKQEKWLSVPVGLCTGLINGYTGSQIIPVLPYLFSLKLDKNTFVQSINISFTLSSLLMLFFLNSQDMLTPPLMMTSAVGILVAGVIVPLGNRIRTKLKDETYKKVVLIFLLLNGAALILKF